MPYFPTISDSKNRVRLEEIKRQEKMEDERPRTEAIAAIAAAINRLAAVLERMIEPDED